MLHVKGQVAFITTFADNNNYCVLSTLVPDVCLFMVMESTEQVNTFFLLVEEILIIGI